MEDEGTVGDDEGAGPLTWELDDGEERPAKHARTGRWEKTLHGTWQRWRRLPSALADERRTPFATASALERVCGLAPARGTRWPQEPAAAFARREPQYAADLARGGDPRHGEAGPVPHRVAAAAGCADSAEDESDDDYCGGSGNTHRVRARGRVHALDPAAVRVTEAPETVAEAAHLEPEVLGCARRVLAAEGTSVHMVGRRWVREACTIVQDVLDTVHDRLLDRALAQRSSNDGTTAVKPLGAADVFKVAAEVMLARDDVRFPAITLEEARGATAHVESVLESLQVTDIAAALRELRDEPCLQPLDGGAPAPPTTWSALKPYFPPQEEQQLGIKQEKNEEEENQMTKRTMMPTTEMKRKTRERAKRELVCDMPARVRPWMSSHAWYARLRSYERGPEVWAFVRDLQAAELRREEIVRMRRRRCLLYDAARKAKKLAAAAAAAAAAPEEAGGGNGANSDSGSTTEESPPQTPFLGLS